MDESALKAGDRIRIGDTELRIETGESSALTSGHFDFRQVNALLAGLRALGSGRCSTKVLAIVLDSTLELTGAERGLHLLAEPGGQLVQRLARARGGITLSSAQTSKQIPNEVFATGVDRIVSDLLDDANASRHGGTLALGIRHVLCTPLKVAQYGNEPRAKGESADRRALIWIAERRGICRLRRSSRLCGRGRGRHRERAAVSGSGPGRACRTGTADRIRNQKALLPPDHFSSRGWKLVASTTPCDRWGRPVRLRAGGRRFAVVHGRRRRRERNIAALLTAVVQGCSRPNRI
jgi:hypothetical protein